MLILSSSTELPHPKCVVFELMALVDISEGEPIEGQREAACILLNQTRHFVYKRPHCDRLLDWVFTHGIRCAIWTHQTQRLARLVLKRTFPLKKFEFVKTRRSCKVSNQMYVKDLNTLKERPVVLFDFNQEQIHFSVEKDCSHCVCVDREGNLRKMLSFIRTHSTRFLLHSDHSKPKCHTAPGRAIKRPDNNKKQKRRKREVPVAV